MPLEGLALRQRTTRRLGQLRRVRRWLDDLNQCHNVEGRALCQDDYEYWSTLLDLEHSLCEELRDLAAATSGHPAIGTKGKEA